MFFSISKIERIIQSNQSYSQYCNNYIKTTKYSILTFLPLFLFDQFTRPNIIYFTLINILYFIPLFTPFKPIGSLIPLLIVIGVALFKQLKEDIFRYLSDKKCNEKKVFIYCNNDYNQQVQIEVQNIKVGNFLLIKQEEQILADIIVVKASDDRKSIFIETSNLDGQINLKQKTLLSYLQNTKIYNVKVQPPNKNLYQFSGTILQNNQYIGINNFVARGSKLKQTQWAIGLVIYTGKETKLIMNEKKKIFKQSSFETKIQIVILVLFIIQFLIAFIQAGVFISIVNNKRQDLILQTNYTNYMVNFMRNFLLIKEIIPIALFICIIISRNFVCDYMYIDQQMKVDNQNMTVQSTDSVQQLGRIQYILSDKTGTLTKNQLILKTISIGKQVYGTLQDMKIIEKIHDNLSYSFKDQKLQEKIRNGSKQIEEYMLCLILCHNCFVIKDKFRGNSNDQLSLLYLAKIHQYEFIQKTNQQIIVKIKNQIRKFRIIKVFQFTPQRKKMSIIVKINNSYKMYIKGADSQLFKIGINDFQFYKKHINQMAKHGLRTLVIGSKTLSEQQISKLKKQSKQSKQDIEKYYQKNINIIGTSAVQDKLQDGTIQCINDIKMSGIYIWIITGDKVQTTQFVAISLKLISPQEKIYKLTDCNLRDLENQIQKISQQQKYIILIQGVSFNLIISQQQLLKKFILKTKSAQSVLFCRMNPSQKSMVVQIIKNKLKKITLAIGDGNNDVNMISFANVGVGIFGKQGTRASRQAMFSIKQFRLLWHLLFRYGRQTYKQTSLFCLYFFYKHIIFIIPYVWFNIYTEQTGIPAYSFLYYLLYSMLFTAIPPVVFCNSDYDIRLRNYYMYPQLWSQYNYQLYNEAKEVFVKLYSQGRLNLLFDIKHNIIWILKGFIDSLVIYYLTFGGFLSYDYVLIGIQFIFYKNNYFTLFYITTSWNILILIAYIGFGILLYIIYYLASITVEESYWAVIILFKSPSHYLVLLLYFAYLLISYRLFNFICQFIIFKDEYQQIFKNFKKKQLKYIKSYQLNKQIQNQAQRHIITQDKLFQNRQ